MLFFARVMRLERHCLLCQNLCSTFFVTSSILCSKEVLEEGGNAHIDLMSVLNESPSCRIPNRSNTPAAIIVIEQRKLQVIHLVLPTLVHHLCTPLCFHSLGPVLHPRLHSRSMNRRSAKHIPLVVGSGILKKESIASPMVAKAGSRDRTTVIIIAHALTRLQKITAIMIPNENCTLQFSLVISLLHPLISTSSPVSSVTSHGCPFATIELSLPVSHPCERRMELEHIQKVGEAYLPPTMKSFRRVLLNVTVEVWFVIRNRFRWFDRNCVL